MKTAISLIKAIVLIPCFLILYHNAYGSENYDGKTLADVKGNLTVPRNVMVKTGTGPEVTKLFSESIGGTKIQRELQNRTANILAKIGKNIVLENTRGSKEIAIYQKVAPAVVIVATNSSYGSGSIVDREGHVITNWHVVKDDPEVIVIFKPKGSAELTKELAFSALVEKTDPVSDLALLKIKTPPKNLTRLPLGDASTLSVGQDVYAIGHPSGEIWTYTKGIISQIRPVYEWRTPEGSVHRAKIIQTQTPINPGSSGGPLIDDRGTLIGINSFQRPGEGLNYSVSVDEIITFLTRKEAQISRHPKYSQGVRRNEPYDTNGRGWPNILGCYVRTGSPPPDLWLVFESADEPPAYAAADFQNKSRVDTIIVSDDETWQNQFYLLDLDCDGIVDLIGIQYAGEEEISTYRKPEKKLVLREIASELDMALKNGKLPYPNVRVCQ